MEDYTHWTCRECGKLVHVNAFKCCCGSKKRVTPDYPDSFVDLIIDRMLEQEARETIPRYEKDTTI